MESVGTDSTNSTLWDVKGKLDYVDEWFLMRSPVPILGLWLMYLTFVLKLGPVYMKGKRPFELTRIIIVYNALQILISCVLFYMGFSVLWKFGVLQEDCYTNAPEAERTVTTGLYYYFMAKFSELLETIFFVLRKKYRQVSFLHIYHHSATFICTWGIVKFEPSPITIFLGTINSFVHIVMYSYYALSAFPDLNKYLWWKVYITKLQLVQFVVIIIYTFLDYKYSQCKPSYTLLGIIFFNLVFMIFLFGNFYVKAYLSKDTLKQKKRQNRVTNNHDMKKEKVNNNEDYANGVYKNGNEPNTNGQHKNTENTRRMIKLQKELSEESQLKKSL